MATTPVTPAAPAPAPAINDLLTQALSPTGLKLTVGGTLPGEALFTTLINAWSSQRMTMSQTNRDGFDSLFLLQATDIEAVWRGMWVLLGVLK